MLSCGSKTQFSYAKGDEMLLKVFTFLLIFQLVKCFCPWPPVIKDCILSEWSTWSSCSAKCGFNTRGHQMRIRSIKTIGTCWGRQCGQRYENRLCYRSKCCPVNCIYSWSEWSSCKGCGSSGEQTSLRVISQNAKCGGTCNVQSSRKRTCWTWK